MAKMKGKAPEPMSSGPDDWKAHSDMRTLMDAHEIKSDKKRHAAAKAMARQHLARMKAVAMPEGSPGEEAGESAATEKAEGGI